MSPFDTDLGCVYSFSRRAPVSTGGGILVRDKGVVGLRAPLSFTWGDRKWGGVEQNLGLNSWGWCSGALLPWAQPNGGNLSKDVQITSGCKGNSRGGKEMVKNSQRSPDIFNVQYILLEGWDYRGKQRTRGKWCFGAY